MQDIPALVAGIRGAEGGTVRIWERGSGFGVRAGWYTDFEGTGSPSTADITLDANGRAVVYVEQYVDVQVLDADDVSVTTFTVGQSAECVELKSDSIIGQGYSGSPTAINQPISVAAAFDKMATSFGEEDFQVDLFSAAVNIDDAISRMYGALFNVKAYGAVGDGANDDRAAILACKSAAAAAGGSVFFPSGTYRCASNVTWENTSIVAEAGSVSLTTSLWAFEGNTSAPYFVLGVEFQSIRAIVREDSGRANVAFVACEFDPDAEENGLSIGADSTNRIDVLLKLCVFRMPSNSGTPTALVDGTAQLSGYLTIEDCSIIVSGVRVPTYCVRARRIRVRGLVGLFPGSGSNEIPALVSCRSTDSSNPVDADFQGVGQTGAESGALGALISILEGISSPFPDGSHVQESGSSLLGLTASGIDLYELADVGDFTVNPSMVFALRTREQRMFYAEEDGGGVISRSPDMLQYGVHVYEITASATSFTWSYTTGTKPPFGAKGTVIVMNESGGGVTVDVSGDTAGNTSSHTLADGNMSIYEVHCLGFGTRVVNSIQDV